jgi:hypothetical protein
MGDIRAKYQFNRNLYVEVKDFDKFKESRDENCGKFKLCVFFSAENC